MSEEEIIGRLKRIIEIAYSKEFTTFELTYQDVDAIQGLLDLYQKENALLLAKNNGYYDLKEYIKDNYISKAKIIRKIEELEWVEEVYKCQCDSCRDIRDEGRYMAYKELLEEKK